MTLNKNSLQPQKAETLRHRVEEHLREAIVSGRLAPGQKLIERELCEAMGVSRPSLREALCRLEVERLVQIVPHRGPIVAAVTEQDARELYALRALLESYAARQFTLVATPLMIEELRKSVKNLRKLVRERGNREDLLKAKQMFYDVLLRGCGNKLIAEVLLNSLTRINRLRAASLSHPSRLKHSVSEIEQLFACISAGDPDGAAAIAANHVRKAEVAAMNMIAEIKKETGENK